MISHYHSLKSGMSPGLGSIPTGESEVVLEMCSLEHCWNSESFT